MADLMIDTQVMRDAGSGLKSVKHEFENAERTADRGAENIGHLQLREAVYEFAANWGTHRDQILKNITELGEQAEGIGKTFEDLITEFTNALQKKG